MVLTNIYDRYNDQKDDFTVYITEKNFSSNALCLFIYNKQGVGLDFIEPNQEKGLFRSLTIRNERLASIFCDYIENHIPANHAMTKENTNKLLQQLIQSLEG